MRLHHVLDKLPAGVGLADTRLVIEAMVADIFREGKGELVESKDVAKSIGSKTAIMFKQWVAKVK
jgi:hypothetical protein